MTDRLEYEGFLGSVHYAAEDEVFFGKLEGVNDLVTFEATNVADLKTAFIEAVEDYRDLCEQTGKAAFKSFKGSFNVRISANLHRLATIKASREGKSLNQLVLDAIEKEVNSNTK